MMGHALRRPIGPVSPEALRTVEDLGGTLPVFQIPAHIAVKAIRLRPAGFTAGAVEVIGSLMEHNKGIPDIDFAGFQVKHSFQAHLNALTKLF
jgi:hypothetical protein